MIKKKVERHKAPKIIIPENISIAEAQKKIMSSGMPFFFIKQGLPDLIRLEILFDAGTIKHENPLVPNLTNSMLDEGTKKYKASELADKLDFMATSLSLNVGKHTSSITVHLLEKYFEEVMEPLQEVVLNPSFPENEFGIVHKYEYQNFLIKQEKIEYLASKKFSQVIFGDAHPYGKSLELEHFNSATPEQLKVFHKNFYQPEKALMLLSGQVSDKHFSILNNYFGFDYKESAKGFDYSKIKIIPNKDKVHLVHKPNAVQAALRIGKTTINKTRPDYIKLNIANIVLGGYFGSRLMTNIREDKGYTYGIYSSLGSLFAAGYFLISAETKAESAKLAVKEIKTELKKLRTYLVSEDELKTVRHYMLGSLLENFDGPEANADAFKSVYFYGMGYDYYYKYIEILKTITPEDIRDIADKYLHEDSMYEIVCTDENTYV